MTTYDIDIIYETCSIFQDFNLDELKAELENLASLNSGNDSVLSHEQNNSTTSLMSGSSLLRTLDISFGEQRDLTSALDEELIVKIRNVYLQYIRTSYQQQINSGRLPRGSNALLVLLSSIEIGLETVHIAGHQDWDAVEKYINSQSIFENRKLKEFAESSSFTKIIWNWFKKSHNNEKIQICTSLIIAHKTAMNNIPRHLGEHEHIDTPEEALVCMESQEIIDAAELILASMDQDVLTREISILISRSILFHEEDLINHFVEEGILTAKEAIVLVSTNKNDFEKINGKCWTSSCCGEGSRCC